MNIRGKEISNWYIVGSTLLIFGIVLALLFFIFRSQSGDGGDTRDSFFGFLLGRDPIASAPEELSTGSITEDQKLDQILFRISADPVVGATVSSSGDKVRYFKRSTGHLFENTFEGDNEVRISNVTIPAIESVQWTPSKEYAIISYYADASLRYLYSHYSGTTSIESAFLPKDIDDITTSQTANTIGYTIRSGNETSLFTARADNTGIKNVFTTPIADFELAWPVANRISLKTKSSAFAESFLFTLDPATKQFTRLLAGKKGLDTLWSPSGADLLYMETTREEIQVTLRVFSLANNTETVLPIATVPEKCAWAPSSGERVLYCGIPQTIPSPARLPDDWWQGTISFDDALWRITVDTGVRQQLLPTRQLDTINLFLAEDESFLFFTNKKDNSLWGLRLK